MSEKGFLGNTAYGRRHLMKILVSVFPLLYLYGWYCIYHTESAAFILRTVEVELLVMMLIVAFYIGLRLELGFLVRKVLTLLYSVYHTSMKGRIVI